MFKKSTIATLVAATLASSFAVAETQQAEPKYDHSIYGLIALQAAYRDYENADQHGGVQLNNESRLGWRGYANLDILPADTKFVWQIEAGYVDPSLSDKAGSYFGERDTFVGLDSAKYGLLRMGRVLTPIYELVDWPASNPGLGDIYDWGGSALSGNDFNDRQSNTIRWDSPELWSGFTMDVAVGAGEDRDGESTSKEAKDNYFHGIAVHQKFDFAQGHWMQLDFAYEMNYDTVEFEDPDADKKVDAGYWDNQTYLVGIQGGHGSVGYYAQYRHGTASFDAAQGQAAQADETEGSYSLGLSYSFGADNKWQAKAGYAAVTDKEVEGSADVETENKVWSTQLLYAIDSNAVVYARFRDVTKTDNATSYIEASTGIEYWF